MRPKRYPYSGNIKASTSEIVKAWEDDYSDWNLSFKGWRSERFVF